VAWTDGRKGVQRRSPNDQAGRLDRLRYIVLVVAMAVMFLFAPSMFGVGLSAGNAGARAADSHVAADQLATHAVGELVSRP
jgi:hypothetical protein